MTTKNYKYRNIKFNDYPEITVEVKNNKATVYLNGKKRNEYNTYELEGLVLENTKKIIEFI